MAIEDTPTEANCGTTAYRLFVEACAAEDRGETAMAEHLFRQAIDLEPGMAAALTNLGNLMYRRGELPEARRFYEQALDHDPNQPEARYNLANLLEDCGDIDLAIAELRKVQWPTRPQLWQATGVVIIVCIVVGVYIAALDAVFFRASRWLIDQYAAH